MIQTNYSTSIDLKLILYMLGSKGIRKITLSILINKKYTTADTANVRCRDQDSNLGYFGHNEGY